MANPRSVTVGLGVNHNRGAKQGLGGLGVPRSRKLATTKGAARSGRRRKARWWRQAGSIRMDPGAKVAGRQPARLKKLMCLTRSTPPSGLRGARCRRRKGEAVALTEGARRREERRGRGRARPGSSSGASGRSRRRRGEGRHKAWRHGGRTWRRGGGWRGAGSRETKARQEGDALEGAARLDGGEADGCGRRGRRS